MASSLRKNFPTLVSAVLVASDLAAIFLSVVFCYWLRFFSPLVRFCSRPEVDSTKEEYAFRPPTLAPPDRLSFRLRRWLRRHLPARVAS